MKVTLDQLQKTLERAWSAETSYDASQWSVQNPASGQCAVTACIVQDYLGGEILWGEALTPAGKKISHFFNKVAGQTIDLTAVQFPAGTTLPEGGPHPEGADARVHILSYETTRKRYDQLAARVGQSLRGLG